MAAVLGLLGKKALDNAKPAPERAIDQAQQTIAVIKEPFADADAVDGAASATASGPTTPATAREAGGGHPRWHTGVRATVSLTRTAPSTPSGRPARRGAAPARSRPW